ncbi:hypothetical protein TH70_0276 [Streptococcus agalactiae]|nr:hypothetical protein TH70_0276 [Streptococcus agalactiae]
MTYENNYLDYNTKEEEMHMAIEIFGPDFRKELLEDLIALNREALKIAQTKNSKSIEWVTMKQLEKETGWGRTKLSEWRDEGNFSFKRSSLNGKVLYDLADVNRFLRTSGFRKGV